MFLFFISRFYSVKLLEPKARVLCLRRPLVPFGSVIS